MKTTGIIVSVLFLLLSLHSIGQTKRIAHKSHSGKANTFSVFGNDNFGLPAISLDSVRKVSAKQVVRYRSYGYSGSRPIVDTITNDLYFSNTSISTDSLKKLFPTVKFIGFDKKVVPAKKATTVSKRKKCTKAK